MARPVRHEDALARIRRQRIARYRSAPPTWSVALRPIGYLLLFLVWSAILGVALLLPLVLPIQLSENDWNASDQLTRSDPVTVIVYVAVIVLVAAPLLGYVFLAIPIAAGSLAMLSLTYVVRSLRPSYRQERLSATGWSQGTIGLSVLPVGLSLLPVRMTRWSAFWAGSYSLGWMPSGGTFLAAILFGIGYFATVAWVMWPPQDAAQVASGLAVSAVFLAATVVLLAREARRRFFRPREPDGST